MVLEAGKSQVMVLATVQPLVMVSCCFIMQTRAGDQVAT